MKQQIMICAALVVMTASFASAQTAGNGFRGFIDGGVAADFDANTYSHDTSAPTPAVFASIGGKLPRGWSVRFEATLPAWHDEDRSYGYRTGTSTVTESGTNRHRISTYSFLLGRDFAMGRRVNLTLLGGLSAAHHADREEYVVDTNRAGVVTSRASNERMSEMLSAGTFGADLVIGVTPRVAIVPSLRTHALFGYEGGFTVVRPGVAVRWRF